MAADATGSADPIVRIEDVQKSYDGAVLVVRNLNLEVARGEFLTLLGPSGSGKTTTLMMLAGFEAPTEGRIFFKGRQINNLPPYKRGIGVVFQNYALFPHMSVADNIAFPLTVRGMTAEETRRRVERALSMVALDGFGGRRPAQLSGGQQQRVALARALVFEPDLVLLDEPLGALDKQLREQMQYELKQIHEKLGVAMIYVTHDQSEALTMSDRIAVFNEGVVQQMATPRQLYEEPENPFVAQFIGESNRLSGRIERVSGAECAVRLDDGSLVLATGVGSLAEGFRVSLSLRPEKVRIGARAPDRDNVFEGTVKDLIYLGDATRVLLNVCGGQDFIVKIPNEEESPVSERGETVRVAWHSRDCRAFAAREADKT